MVSLVEGYGFTVMQFENLTFEDQVRIASGARFLVSNHGAGLMNMLFMPTSSRVLEIRKRDPQMLCFYSLASGLGLDYFYVFADEVDPQEDSHNTDLLVDCDRLEQAVAAMIAE